MKVIIPERVYERLEKRLKFLKDNLDYSSLAISNLRKSLLSRAKDLSNNPRIGQFEEYLEDLEEGHRRIIEGNFKIIYLIEEDHIYITDFFHTSQDPLSIRG